jgi:hypothetical protein
LFRLGSTEQHVTQTLDVLFAARFLKCEERQYVDSKQDQSSIECSYSGNPQPKLIWLRQTDQKVIESEPGVTIEKKDEQNGKYKSIVRFDRNRFLANPPLQENLSGDDYYQRLLTNGFLVKLTVNGNEKSTRIINIVRDANQIRAKLLNNSQKMSFSMILLFILQIILR